MKKKYDSAIVFLYAIGKENLLPTNFRRQIPYSTISTWRKADYSKYLGHEFRYHFDEAFKTFELAAQNKRLKELIYGLSRSWLTLSHILLPIIKQANGNKELQTTIIAAINKLKELIGLDRTLRLLKLSKPLYYQWVLEARFDCFDSYTHLCVKRHPQQLGAVEVQKIKTLLTSNETDHWPIVSIQGEALRKKTLVASLYSWYKYARLWGIKKKPAKKQKKTVGIVAKCPNEYLHIDTTFYELIDGKSICISFVMDNFSKMILGYHVAESNNFNIVKNSLTKALKVIATHPDQQHSFLVTDGGKENHNKNIDAFIAKLSKHKITKIRALKDIRFSNSPVEAIHKTMKGRYLRRRKFESISAVNNYLKWAVKDYNMVRPHYKHRPRTPHEAYFNIPLNFDIRDRVKKAIAERVQANKCAACRQCRMGCENKLSKPEGIAKLKK